MISDRTIVNLPHGHNEIVASTTHSHAGCSDLSKDGDRVQRSR